MPKTDSMPVAALTADFGQVLLDPAAFYADPEAIAGDTALTRGQRLLLLDEWVQIILDEQIVARAGLAPGAPPPDDGCDDGDHAALLRDLSAALASVEASPEHAPNLLIRVWRRLIEN